MSDPTPGISDRTPRPRDAIDEFGGLAQDKIDEIYAKYFSLYGETFPDLFRENI